jgi:hypothetical protein
MLCNAPHYKNVGAFNKLAIGEQVGQELFSE